MADVQTENGYTIIANQLLDAICRTRIPGEARQILDVIFRKTYGFQRRKDSISLGQFQEATMMSRSSIVRAIKKLETMNIIVVNREKYITIYSVEKNYEKWEVVTKKRPLSEKQSSYKNVTSPVTKASLLVDKKVTESSYQKVTHKRKKETFKESLKKREGKKQKTTPTIQTIWLQSFGRNPKHLEKESTAKIIKKFGAEKTLQIFQTAVRKNFHSVFTLEKSLDQNGNINPKGNQNNEISKSSIKSRTDYRHDKIWEEQRLKELEAMDTQ